MKGQTIRQKLLFLTLIPALLILALILGSFSYQGDKILNENLIGRGATVSRYFASVAEYGAVTGNLDQLHHVGNSILEKDVIGIRVFDFDKRLIFSQGENLRLEGEASGINYQQGICAVGGDYMIFCAPIISGSVAVGDYEDNMNVEEVRAIGHVELTLSTHLIAEKRREMMSWSLFLLASVLVVAVFLSRRVERQLVGPLSSLSHVVERVRDGDLDMSVNENASGELLLLQQGVSAMLEAIASSRQTMKREIEVATESLREAMEELERRNSELQIEQQRAETASLAKSQFLATMSHEVRTPLSGMIGMLQLLRDSSENRQQHEYIDSVESAAQSLQHLIDDIMDFSRMEVGKLAIHEKPFVPMEVMEEVMVMLTPSAHYKGLEFVFDVDTGARFAVMGDPLRFRQILINLAANAIKFTASGEVVIRAHAESGDGRYRFEIHDSGIGIPHDKQSMVFESFTQLDEGDARSYGGSGLGATISRDLVEMMGGEIGLESEPGKGSCFWFELPWQRVDEGKTPSIYKNDISVLLLEAHPMAAAAISKLLLQHGIKTTQVANEKALWQALQSQHYSWVVVGENGSDSSHLTLLAELAEKLPAEVRLIQLTRVNGVLAADERIEHFNKPLLPGTVEKLLNSTDKVRESEGELCSAPLSVLLAEDEVINARVIIYFLEHLGHRVERVADGRAALQQLKSGDFDCVLMDIRMPGMDGLEATQLWRAEEDGRRTPIIALTANASEEDRQRCLDAGMDDYLTKPVTSQSLQTTLGRYCDGISTSC